MTTAASSSEIGAMFAAMLRHRQRISDVNLSVGRPPQMESDGELVPLPGAAPLTAADTERLTELLIGDDAKLRQELRDHGSCDLAYGGDGGPRFRVNVFLANGQSGIVLRALPTEVPTIESLRLPPVVADAASLANGLVLVTGATGSGKSSTLAALVDLVNRSRAVHVVTLEDPIEFRHRHRLATINQRELGQDFASFASGLRAALRQAPKVILVGEIRDRATMEIALKAAETGHLVLSTLHTIDAGQTVNRIAGMFEAAEQRMVRARLAETLRLVVGQRLLPMKEGGRIAALEVMGTSLQVRDLINNGERAERSFYDVIGDGQRSGWQTYDQHIAALFAHGSITEEVAFTYCTDRSVLRRRIDGIKTERGEATSDLGDLQMQRAVRRR